MGADLYIEAVTNAAREKWKPIFEEAVGKRDRAFDAWKAEHGPLQIKEFDPPVSKYPNPLRPHVAAVRKAYAGMYPDNGYFRDSYNGTNFLNRLGLSWWQDVIPLLDTDSNLTVPAIRKLRGMVAEREVQEIDRAWLEKNHCRVDDDENSPEGWNSYFRKEKAAFLKFLDCALKMEEPIHASL
jgi:hypothetical protein